LADSSQKRIWAEIIRFDHSILSTARPLLLMWLCAVVLGAPLIVAPPLLVRYLIDVALPSSDQATVLRIVALIGATTVLVLLLKSVAAYCLDRAVIQGLARLRAELFEQIQHKDLRSIYGVGVDGIFQRMTHGLTQIRAGMVQFWGELVFGVISTLVGVAVLARIDPLLVLLCIALYLPYLILKNRVFRRQDASSANWDRQLQAYSVIVQVVREAIEGIRLVKASNSASLELSKLNEAQSNYLSEFRRYLRIICQTLFLNGVITLFPEALAYLYLGWRVYSGQASIGSLLAVVGLFPQFRQFMWHFSRMTFHRDGHSAHIRRIEELRNLPEDIYERGSASTVTQTDGRNVEGKVSFQNVAFSFIPGHPVLEDVSFTVKPGEKVGIVGVSGVGKSTLANLLVGIEKPDAGSILIDDVPLSRWSMKALRKSVAYVSQDIYLVNGTIRQNLEYGVTALPEKNLWEALAAADLDELVHSLPRGLDTVIGEGGVRLSGGQRQRLSAARAYLRNPKIVILDEATAALDLESEARMYEGQEKLLGHCTTLVITHRLDSLARMGQIILLEDGRVREQGTHRMLMEQGQSYAALFADGWR
jgi:ABC-type multidrug transport system fused ATPase/permease subunit